MSMELSEQELLRRKSLSALRELGIEPYPAEMYDVTATAAEISNNLTEENKEQYCKVRIAGRIMSRRIMGSASFFELQDHTGRIQVYIRRDDICPEGDPTLYNTVFTNAVTAYMLFHIGANMDQRMQVYIGTMTATALNLRNMGDETIMSLESPDEANRAIGTLDEALKRLNKQRSDLGGYYNRLEHAIRGIDVAAENLQSAESRIRDTDMAKEMVDFTKNQVLQQSGMAILAQANQSTQNVLTLLR